METLTIATLESIHHDNFAGIAPALEPSIGVSGSGTLCDIRNNGQTPSNMEDYTLQEAFYKVCFAIAATQPVHYTSIKPDSPLESFFPRRGRQQHIKAFQKALGVDVDILAVTDSLEWAILLSAALSFTALFFSWKGALTGFAMTGILGWLTLKFGRQLKLDSVRELTEKIAREHYVRG